MKTAIKTMFDKIDEAKVTQQAMVNVLARYKRERFDCKKMLRAANTGDTKALTDRLADLDLSIATVRVLLNREAKNVQNTR